MPKLPEDERIRRIRECKRRYVTSAIGKEKKAKTAKKYYERNKEVLKRKAKERYLRKKAEKQRQNTQ